MNILNIEIRKLTPDLAEDYAHFFEVTPHDDHTVKDELPCYCITWRNDDTYVGNDHWYPTREERRERAIQFVKDGKLQGYLAYHGERIVGWCNATADCQKGVEYLRFHYPIEECRTDVKVKSIFCFVVAPDVQRKGIATRLVEYVCTDAAADGFDFVEAYPKTENTPVDAVERLRLPPLLAGVRNLLNAATPRLNLTGTEKGARYPGIVRHGSVLREQVVRSPIIRQFPIVVNQHLVRIDMDVDWVARALRGRLRSPCWPLFCSASVLYIYFFPALGFAPARVVADVQQAVNVGLHR
jgi:GNAT superfamily N-acetyltransferase